MFRLNFALVLIFVKCQLAQLSSSTFDYPSTLFYKGIPIYFKNDPYTDTQVASNEEYGQLLSSEDQLDDDDNLSVFDGDSGEYYGQNLPLTYSKKNSGIKGSYEDLGLPLYKGHYSAYSVPHYYQYNPSEKHMVTSVPTSSFYVRGTDKPIPIYNTDYKVKLAKGEAKLAKNISKAEGAFSKAAPQRKLFNALSSYLPVKTSSTLEEKGKPYPYSFGYKVSDYYGNSQYRNEIGEKSGAKKGSYGYIDAHGMKREVHYVADHKGFRAWIKTNEPGMTNSNSANVAITAEKSPIIAQYSQVQKKPVYPVQATLSIPSYHALQPTYLSTIPLVTKPNILIKKPLFAKSMIRKPLLAKPLFNRPLLARPLFNRPLMTRPLTSQQLLKWSVLKQPYG